MGLLPKLDAQLMMARARQRAGLADFGDEWFRTPLEALVGSVNGEARLSALGRTIIHKRIVDALTTRLRARALADQHPEIGAIRPDRVLVIAGLQRTGTTLLHRLLGADPRIRAVFSWEALNPVPLEGPNEQARRIRQALRAERGLKYIAPEFFAIHPVEHDMPEEDVLLLDVSFMSQSAEATMHVPSYARWLEEHDHAPAYRYLRQLLSVLLWQRRAPSLVLKSPHHLEHLDTVFDVFPNATIIQTHRDPQRTVPSFASMVCHGASIFSDRVDVGELTGHWLRKIRRVVERSLAARERHGTARFVDVSYYDLIGDPMAELARVYEAVGLDFDVQAEQLAREALRRQVRDRFGRHQYCREDFGLTRDLIEGELGFYRRRFNVPFEEEAA